MATVIPETELRKKAINYISEKLNEGRTLMSLIDEAGSRFNLSPKDTDFLIRFFREHKTQG